jgi:Amt family ammonium transporter
MGIRVSEEEEFEGLDLGEHGNIAYPDFQPVSVTGLHGIGAPGGLAAAGAVHSMRMHPEEA